VKTASRVRLHDVEGNGMSELRSQKQQREQLVRALRAEGKSWVEIADVLRRRYRVNARVALRYAHGWSQRQVADEWNRRWPDELKTFKSFSYWELWPSNTGHAPSLDNLSKLAQLYECAVSDLLANLPDFRHLDTMNTTQENELTVHEHDTRQASPKKVPDNFATPPMQRFGNNMNRREAIMVIGAGGVLSPFAQAGLHEIILNAAHSSAVLHGEIDIPKIDDRTREEVQQDLHLLATNYVVDPTNLGRIFAELVILRDRLWALLNRYGRRPDDARELHLLLGATCVLLASISHDLAEPSAAMIQTRTALTFAELAGHAGLITWIYSTRAMIASWWGTADNVLHHAQCSRLAGQSGVGAIRLAGLEARALAHKGNHHQAVELLQTYRDQLDKPSSIDSLRDLGEVFTFSKARQHYYNAAALVHMYDWEAVEKEASAAIRLYDNPATGQRWPVTMTLSQVYLAQARLSKDGPEAAQEALIPVFSIPDEQRIPQTAQALNRIRAQLHSRVYANLPVARDLDEAICNFRPSADHHKRS
jgi:transcriptional regulator with XRE-family HTH domain